MAQPQTASEARAASDPGDPGLWLDEHGDYLFAFALAAVRNADTAEELVQETFAGGIDSIESFEGASSVRTWLVGILKHKVVDHFRAASRRAMTGQLKLSAAVVDEQFGRLGKWKKPPGRWGRDPAADPASDPTAGAERAEFWAVFERCLGELPRRTADAFVLAERYQLSGEDLGRVLEITPNNAYVMLFRARSALRACLDQNWFGGSKKKGC